MPFDHFSETMSFLPDLARQNANSIRRIHQTIPGVVLPKDKTPLCARREHPVRLIRSFRDKIIYHDTYIRILTAKHKRILIPYLK